MSYQIKRTLIIILAFVMLLLAQVACVDSPPCGGYECQGGGCTVCVGEKP